MSTLTVTEKEHWKNRIARRIEKQIETITASDANFFERIDRQARQRALESLGIAEHQAELDEIERQQEVLQRRERRLRKAMLAKVRGVPPEELDGHPLYRHDSEVDGAIRKRKAVHENELLAESELGQRVLHLRQEGEELLDVVWLATSSKQIKQLWAKVAELLGAQPSQLHRDALAIDPVE